MWNAHGPMKQRPNKWHFNEETSKINYILSNFTNNQLTIRTNIHIKLKLNMAVFCPVTHCTKQIHVKRMLTRPDGLLLSTVVINLCMTYCPVTFYVLLIKVIIIIIVIMQNHLVAVNRTFTIIFINNKKKYELTDLRQKT